MSELALVALFIFVIAMIVFVIVYAFSSKAQANIQLPFNIRFKIKAHHENQRKQAKPPASAQPTAWLAIKQHHQSDWQFNLDAHSMIYIGRDADNQLPLLRDPAADSRHAVIYFENNRYYLNNLSAKGTRVNGKLITKQVLGDGNTIRVGNTKLIFHERRK